ncbi:hypothetical protein E3J62_01345 [candidate division TA06 bacterium]|uniref:Peptidase S74 domain-containing protein n=1 Tax=candidate division TA06 bacterium TaxID=2250710 RepID=A0A523UY42_UNCT6|nr:MAG: hypothetical protein E3J62_01345 [candidate division TA06 bacterium]
MTKRILFCVALAALAVSTVGLAQQKKNVDEVRLGRVKISRIGQQVVRPAIAAPVIPWHINYQGYLTDDAGNPLNDTLSMTFSIYTASAGGTELWNEAQNIGMEDGLFNVVLGSLTPIPPDVFQTGESRWLELVVEAQILLPRTEITSVGYAYRAFKADTADYALDAPSDSDWTVTGNVLYPVGQYGLAMRGNVLRGDSTHTHANFGVECTTGTAGQNDRYCTVGGGHGNMAGEYATVCGGEYNTARGTYASVGGGYNNTADGFASTVSGGTRNFAGDYGTVGGGEADTVLGAYSFAAGSGVKIAAGADYTFAFGRDFTTSTPNAVIFYHSPGPVRVGIGNTAPTHLLDVGGAYCDGGAWVNGSSREHKEQIAELSLEEALEAIGELKPVTFNYKSDRDERCVGFIAEDVPELVATKDRKGLSPMDIAAVLTRVVQYQQEEFESLKKELAALRK